MNIPYHDLRIIVRQSWNNLWNELLHLVFQFRYVLLKNLTDPFIFSIAIVVEKMEVQQVNNQMTGQELTKDETNHSDPNKSYNLLKGIW